MTEARRLAVITGASSGIGSAFARALAGRGYDLALVARRGERLQELGDELARQFQVSSTPLRADLNDEADVSRVEQFLVDAPQLGLLVNGAGFGSMGRFYEAPPESQASMHRVHVMATMRLTHAALRNLTTRGDGGVINVSSVAAYSPHPGSVSYHATKVWMNSFTEGLYLELKSAGSRVRVQALCPGFTLTEFHQVLGVKRDFISGTWWMPAEEVVEASLAGLDADKLFVVPGWRYKLLVALLRLLPRRVLHYATLRGPASLRRERMKTHAD